MFKGLRRWWREIEAHWRQKNELLLAADKALTDLGVAKQSFEDIELHCLRLGVMALEVAVYNQLVGRQVLAAGSAEGPGGLSPTVH